MTTKTVPEIGSVAGTFRLGNLVVGECVSHDPEHQSFTVEQRGGRREVIDLKTEDIDVVTALEIERVKTEVFRLFTNENFTPPTFDGQNFEYVLAILLSDKVVLPGLPCDERLVMLVETAIYLVLGGNHSNRKGRLIKAALFS